MDINKHLAVIIGISLSSLLYASYSLGEKQSQTEETVFTNEQVEVLFKSEVESCNIINNTTCGVGVIQVAGTTYFHIVPETMVEKTLQKHNEGFDLFDSFAKDDN